MSLKTSDKESVITKEIMDVEKAAAIAIKNSESLQAILDGLTAKDNVYRENCFHVVLKICEKEPQLLYPKWDDFAGMLSSSNAFFRAIGLQIIARLAGVDKKRKFEDMFERFFRLLDDEKIMVSRYLVQNIGLIIEAKPHLKERIIKILLGIDKTRHPEGRKALLKADVIASIEKYFDAFKDNELVMSFAEAALHSSSPKARKAAKSLLSRI